MRPRLSRQTTTQMYKLIHEYMSKHQRNIHTDELIHKYMAIFIHNLHSNTFASSARSQREKHVIIQQLDFHLLSIAHYQI